MIVLSSRTVAAPVKCHLDIGLLHDGTAEVNVSVRGVRVRQQYHTRIIPPNVECLAYACDTSVES